MELTTGFAEINHARLYYEIAGEGEPLVLVHAGIADSRMWDDQFDLFSRRYRVVRYDRRGFGESQMVAGRYSHHQDLHGLLQLLEFQRAVLVGCSQGGKTIIDFTLQHPQKVEALILVTSALSGFVYDGKPPRQAAELEQAEAAGDIDRVNELELQIWVDGPRRSPHQVNPILRELVREMNRIALSTPEDLGDEGALEPPAANRLSEINAPTLIIMGDLDQPRTLSTGDWLGKYIPRAQRLVMKGTAHLPNMERPEEFNERVLGFISNLKG